MNEWPENLTGLDLNWNLFETANKALKTTLILLIVLAGIGLAQATNLTTEPAHRAGDRNHGMAELFRLVFRWCNWRI